MTVTINPSLSELLVPADQLKQHPANPRVGDVPAIIESMRTNGVYRPVYAQRSTGYVIAGNHTYAAMRELDFDTIPAVLLDIDDEAALRILLADNRTADLGAYDNAQLADLLEGLSSTTDALLGTGYDFDDLEALVSALDELESESTSLDEEDEERRAQLGRSFDVYSQDQVIDAAAEHYLSAGYPYRKLTLAECMQEINGLAALDDASLRLTTLGYAVADTYHPHRLSARAENHPAPAEVILDEPKLRHGLSMIIQQDSAVTDAAVRTVCNFVRGAQACANFRPGFALSLYRRFTQPGDSVLDTSTGYGGRLVGFLASHCGKYIGIDPNTTTHASNLIMAHDLGAGDRVELINLPAEDVPINGLTGKIDFAFTSPPYFSKEHYSDEDTQSWKRYPTGEQWRDQFLDRMIALQYAALKPGGYAVINIADVTINRVLFPLSEWTVTAALRAGFELDSREDFPLGQKRVPGAGTMREASEPLLIFRRPA